MYVMTTVNLFDFIIWYLHGRIGHHSFPLLFFIVPASEGSKICYCYHYYYDLLLFYVLLVSLIKLSPTIELLANIGVRWFL